MLVPVAELMPDQPDYKNPGSTECHNVYPRTQQSYGPISSFAQYSSALSARCQGAYTCIDTDGNTFVIAGDATKLYKLGSGTTTFADVSKVGGYSIVSEDQWKFTQFGSRVLACNYQNAIQSYTLGTSTLFADLAASAPRARYIATVKDFVMVGGTYDPTYLSNPQRVWWSAINDCTNWPTPGTVAAAQVQSDYQDIPGDQGWMMGLVGNLGTADVAIFFERAIWRGVYSGSPMIFQFHPAEGVRGTPSSGSIAQLGAMVFYLGEDGFYAFDGSNSTPIGAQKVDKWFYSNLNQSYIHRITSSVDPINKLVFWAYPSKNSADGHCDALIIYNWALNRWSTADVNCEYIFRSLSFGYSLDGLDATGYTLDTLPYSLDSRIWTGGSIVLSAFDTTHKMGYFTGDNLAPIVETSEIDFSDAGGDQEPASVSRRVLVTSARPIVDGGTPSVAIGHRNRMVDAFSYGATIPMNVYGECPQRTDARYVRAQITLPAASSFSHISGVDLTFKLTGTR